MSLQPNETTQSTVAKGAKIRTPLHETYANLLTQDRCSFPTSSMLVGSLESFQRSRAVISLGGGRCASRLAAPPVRTRRALLRQRAPDRIICLTVT